MNNYDKILVLVEKNNGYITTKEVVENGIDRIYLSNLIKKGRLERICRGFYGLSNYYYDGYYRISSMSQYARFSLATALYYHNLSDRVPIKFDVTVPSGYSGSLQKEKGVNLNYVDKKFIDLGVIEVATVSGTKVKMYDMERTICDIIKNRKKMDPEIFSKALKEYAKRSDKDIRKLRIYAEKLKIEDKVYQYMEILL